ncbi:hypothetical protein [Actinoplanes xinjiangensis]|uniref:Uncharacterized protein n=1 Tax=Actinoplanes xinjiangensis TaxID=512350 RepID=A0A316FGY2_9ACTN|nr:hypothetical protein [Actinoplanes xinjiangensis]PWK47503.1 hypothetical protein BC793_107113 [Actinoplanes xinjiangensis]GIF39568.1 hypothetical protein Axi01nite_38790 [Actinoplanes xinjiangensis]
MTTQEPISDEDDDGQRVGESAAPQATGEWGSILDEDLPPVVPDAEVEVPKGVITTPE